MYIHADMVKPKGEKTNENRLNIIDPNIPLIDKEKIYRFNWNLFSIFETTKNETYLLNKTNYLCFYITKKIADIVKESLAFPIKISNVNHKEISHLYLNNVLV